MEDASPVDLGHGHDDLEVVFLGHVLGRKARMRDVLVQVDGAVGSLRDDDEVLGPRVVVHHCDYPDHVVQQAQSVHLHGNGLSVQLKQSQCRSMSLTEGCSPPNNIFSGRRSRCTRLLIQHFTKSRMPLVTYVRGLVVIKCLWVWLIKLCDLICVVHTMIFKRYVGGDKNKHAIFVCGIWYLTFPVTSEMSSSTLHFL